MRGGGALGDGRGKGGVPVQAEERALEIMRSDPGLTVVTPEGWMAATLRTLIESRGFVSEESRLLAWFDAKVMDERRITGTMNKYFNCPSVDKDRLAEWLRALIVLMAPSRDVGVVLSGSVAENVAKITEFLPTQRRACPGSAFVN